MNWERINKIGTGIIIFILLFAVIYEISIVFGLSPTNKYLPEILYNLTFISLPIVFVHMLASAMRNKNNIFNITAARKTVNLIILFSVIFIMFNYGQSIASVCPFLSFQSIFVGNLLIDGKLTNTSVFGFFAVPLVLILVFFTLLALLFGRAFCGWICPFGTILEYIENASLFAKREIKKLYPELKYISLAAVILGIILLKILYSEAYPIFCEVCPVSFLYDGFFGIISVLTIPLLVMTFALTPFYGRKIWCKYFCPLGAFFGLISKFHIFKIRPEGECVNCKMCQKSCPMDVPVSDYAKQNKSINDDDCIKCFECTQKCPKKILKKI